MPLKFEKEKESTKRQTNVFIYFSILVSLFALFLFDIKHLRRKTGYKQENTYTIIYRGEPGSKTTNSTNSRPRGPHVNLIKLKSRPELGLTYHPGANIINGNNRYATIVANNLTPNSSLNYYYNIPIACSAWIQIGYGCFVVIPYFESNLVPESHSDTFSKLNKIIPETITKWNIQGTGNVVILYLKSSTSNNIIQIAQISRLFITHFVKYTTTAEEYAKNLQETYFLTTDADLIPLSAKYYYQNSYDWNLVNIVEPHSSNKQIYVALSCVGALARTWYNTIPEKKYEVEFYNDTGIRQMFDIERKSEVEKRPYRLVELKGKGGVPKVDWFMDQTLISKWIEEYGEEFGWDTISPRKQRHFDLRVDRPTLHQGKWDGIVDRQIYSEPWKDSHICQESYLFHCFWKIYFLLKPILAKERLLDLVNYKFEFTEKILENVVWVGSGRQVTDVLADQFLTKTFIKELSDLKLPEIDMRRVWTHHFPKEFQEKPGVVDWENERLFKVDVELLKTTKRKTVFYVIPRYKIGNESVELELNKFAMDQFKKQANCNKCYEILYKK